MVKLSTPCWSQAALAAPAFAPSRFAAIVIDADSDAVLYERNADAARYPAALTKVMTLYLAYDAIERGTLHLNNRVVMSSFAASRPLEAGLRAGRSLSVPEAVDILVVKSANDVATALAERIGGSPITRSSPAAAQSARRAAAQRSFASTRPEPSPRTGCRLLKSGQLPAISCSPAARRY